jgi:hypothetical protein
MSEIDTPGEPAHDVLAAEEFAMPARDPELQRRPVLLPDDPMGTPEPHDILAAEEFAMPAPGYGSGRSLAATRLRATGSGGLLLVVAGVLLLLWRLVRR